MTPTNMAISTQRKLVLERMMWAELALILFSICCHGNLFTAQAFTSHIHISTTRSHSYDDRQQQTLGFAAFILSMSNNNNNPSRRRKKSSKDNKDDVEPKDDLGKKEPESNTNYIEKAASEFLQEEHVGFQSRTSQSDHHHHDTGRHRSNAKTVLEQAKAINTELIRATTAQLVLAYFVAKGGARGTAGGGIFNSVNYSTCLHRLARFATIPSSSSSTTNTPISRDSDLHPEKIRKSILTDPRFAILTASLCEAIAGMTPSLQNDSMDELDTKGNVAMIFCSRELSNIAWAIAKLKLAPPADIWPILRPDTSSSSSPDAAVIDTTTGEKRIRYMSRYDIQQDLISTSKWVRQQVLQVAKQRSQSEYAVSSSHPWIPTLSQLSGKLLDVIAMNVLESVDTFKPQELANMLWAFSTADRADPYFFEILTDRLVSSMEKQTDTPQVIKGGKNVGSTPFETLRIKPQELSNSIWALASAGIRGKNQLRLISFTADILDEDNGSILDSFKPQELSNTAWGISTLLSKRENIDDTLRQDEEDITEDSAAVRIFRWIAKAIRVRADEFKSQELSNSVWSWATCGFGCTADETINLRIIQTEDDRALVIQALEAVAKSALKRLHKFRPQELNNLAWGCARLGYYDNTVVKLFEGVGNELIKRHSQFAPQDIGTTLWSCATVEYFNAEVFQAAASELNIKSARFFKPQEMSNTVWALATAGALPKYVNVFDTTLVPARKRVSLSEIVDDPITECFAAAAAELIRRPQDFKEQEIKDVLWSLSKAGIRHPLAFRRVAEHLVGTEDEGNKGRSYRGLTRFSPQGLGNLAWSFAKQAQLADAVMESIINSSGRLAVYETMCLDVGESLIHRLFTNIATSALHHDGGLSRFKPQDLSNTCWSFSTLGMLHLELFTAVALQVHERLSAWKANKQSQNPMLRFKQEIANLAWSYATLNFCPKGMITDFAPYIVAMCSNDLGYGHYDVKSISKYLKMRQEAANLSWSCCVLKEYPPELVRILYMALMGDGDEPSALNKVYADDGLQKQAIMTLFYVQMALDFEAPELRLRLPENFPDGWWENTSSRKVSNQYLEDKSDTSSMLELTTSRLQNDVSRALTRIGFNHIQEHLIITDDLETSYGIKLSSQRIEFLSIDIARLEDRIGVEVDGPAHFVNILDSDSQHSRRQPNGPTALKHRLLSHLGWKIMHVPFWEWRDVDGDEEREEEYCKDIILSI